MSQLKIKLSHDAHHPLLPGGDQLVVRRREQQGRCAGLVEGEPCDVAPLVRHERVPKPHVLCVGAVAVARGRQQRVGRALEDKVRGLAGVALVGLKRKRERVNQLRP